MANKYSDLTAKNKQAQHCFAPLRLSRCVVKSLGSSPDGLTSKERNRKGGEKSHGKDKRRRQELPGKRKVKAQLSPRPQSLPSRFPMTRSLHPPAESGDSQSASQLKRSHTKKGISLDSLRGRVSGFIIRPHGSAALDIGVQKVTLT